MKETPSTFQNLSAICFGNFWRCLGRQLISDYSQIAKWILFNNPRQVTFTTLTKRVVAILKFSAPTTITLREVIIARHDVIRDQLERLHLYSNAAITLTCNIEIWCLHMCRGLQFSNTWSHSRHNYLTWDIWDYHWMLWCLLYHWDKLSQTENVERANYSHRCCLLSFACSSFIYSYRFQLHSFRKEIVFTHSKKEKNLWTTLELEDLLVLNFS